MDDFENIMNGAFGKDRPAVYTDAEIEKARKLSRKNGKTLLENLQEMTGRTESILTDVQNSIRELNESLKNDPFLQDTSAGRTAADQAESSFIPAEKNKEEEPVKDPDFSGLSEVLSGTVYGQDAYLRSLIVAFRRPFVLKEEEGHAKNCIFLTGPEDTGKHLSLSAIVEELHKRNILSSGEIRKMDLSAYPNADSGTVFLQDLYAVLSSPARVILFENYGSCHISCLNSISELVLTGKCPLSGRYISQNGQLVSVTNAFAAEIIDSYSAAGRYLVFAGTGGLSDLSDIFGAPFVNALGDVCETAPLSEESFLKISEDQLKLLQDKSLSQLSFVLKPDENIASLGAEKAEKKAGVAGILAFYQKLLRGLADIRLNGDYPKDQEVSLTVENGQVLAGLGDTRFELFSLLSSGYTGDLEAVKKEMDSIVGLTEVKEYILSLEEYYGIQKKRREEGLKASEVNKHMIFTGSPGTGKTTIARIISRYLKAIGVLSGGQLVEVSRADLVGRYVGHTAPLTKQVLNSAIGGVLFIDEAYSLYRGTDDSFGLEAIDTLVKGIEDNRDDLIVILAGYSHEMEEFLTSNSGLKSRFPNIINFPDYTGQELLDIAKITAKSKGYTLDEGLMEPLLFYFNAVQALKAETAGNGRLVRNKIEEAILNQSRRLVAEPDADLSLLTSRDFVLDDIDKL